MRQPIFSALLSILALFSAGVAVAQDQPLTAKEIFKRYRASVVQITADSLEGGKPVQEVGSGFFYKEDFLVATCYHVIDGAVAISVRDGEGKDLTVTHVVFDKAADVAILKLDKGSGRASLKPTTFEKVSVGDPIFVIGNPLGLLPDTISTGIISGKRQVNDIPHVQINAAISGGNSGGPVITEAGEVAGIVSFSMVEGQALNMAVSIDLAEKAAKQDPLPVQQFYSANKVGKKADPKENPAKGESLALAQKHAAMFLGRYELEVARYAILECGVVYAQKLPKDFLNQLADGYKPVRAALASLDMDEDFKLALLQIGTSPEKVEKLGKALQTLDKRWIEYIGALCEHLDTASRVGPGKALTGTGEKRRQAYLARREGESAVLDLLTSEPWLESDTLVEALPANVAYLDDVMMRLFVLPDPDAVERCKVGAVYIREKAKLKKGDEVVGVRGKSATAFIPVQTWRDLITALWKQKLEGEVVLKVKRNGSSVEVPCNVGKSE